MRDRPARRAIALGYSSARFGACEVCHVDVSDVWMGTPDDGFRHVFGHERCVRASVAEGAEVTP